MLKHKCQRNLNLFKLVTLYLAIVLLTLKILFQTEYIHKNSRTRLIYNPINLLGPKYILNKI